MVTTEGIVRRLQVLNFSLCICPCAHEYQWRQKEGAEVTNLCESQDMDVQIQTPVLCKNSHGSQVLCHLSSPLNTNLNGPAIRKVKGLHAYHPKSLGKTRGHT